MSTPSLPQPEDSDLEAIDSVPTSIEKAAGLVREWYPRLYRLAFAGLESTDCARTAAVGTLAEALRSPSMSAGGWRLWIFNLLLQQIGRLPQARPTRPTSASTPENEFQTAVRHMVDGWDEKEARLAVLHYLMGWPVSEIAALLKVGASAVEAQLDIFRRQLTGLPRPAPAAGTDGLPATLWTPTAANWALIPTERLVVSELDLRWPLPVLSPQEVESIAVEVERAAAAGGRFASARRRLLPALIAVLAVACLASAVTAGSLVFGASSRLVRSTPTPTIAGFPTPFPATESVSQINRRFTTEEIIRRWDENPGLWHSLALDVQIVDYGPENYIGPARRYLARGWVLQPNQAIELFGFPGEPPGRVSLVGGGRAFQRSYVDDRTESRAWSGESGDLLYDPTLRNMIFPHTSHWAQQPGSFWWVETGRLLGRPVVVFDWLNHLNQRQARLWLDARTGILLRLQEFDGEQFDRIRRESVATDIAFERVEPPPELLVAANRSQESSAALPGFQAIVATPTPAITAAAPTSLPTDPAPPGMDPARSRLVFQFPDASVGTPTNGSSGIQAALFADGYYLGQVRFGLPWGLRCLRSGDGRRIAFNAASDGAAAADDTMRWLNLSRPDQVYRVAPGLRATDFAFSPAGASLAAAGDDDASQTEGVYLVNLATGEHRLLLEAADAHSLAFSPDGEFLAFIARLPNERLPAVIVLHVDTRQIAFQGEPGLVDSPPAGSPIDEWEIAFPVRMGGMESCALP